MHLSGWEVGGLVVGLLRPPDGEGPGEAVERGVRLALAESASAARLVVRSTRGPWTTVGEAARDLIRDVGANGLVSALDGKGSHVAAQLATRLRRPLAVATEAPPLLAHTGVAASPPRWARRPATCSTSPRSRWPGG